jgi:four helix bundle protein
VIRDDDLLARAFRFSCDIVALCKRLAARGPIQRRIALQLVDAGTSIGANLEEGAAGQTKPDFVAKHAISLKESREARYWLRIVGATERDLEADSRPLLQEANEFVAMLTTLVRKAKSSNNRGGGI